MQKKEREKIYQIEIDRERKHEKWMDRKQMKKRAKEEERMTAVSYQITLQ